ncbi:MAG: radical SAM protein [Candidatus Gottesmanbacteria bacterium]
MNNKDHLLNFVEKLFQPKVRARLKEYIQKRSTLGPLIVELDPTTACNFLCPDCINSNLLNKGQIESQRLFKLLQEFKRAGVKGIIFIGGGEPLCHTSMPQPIIDAHKLGIEIGLTTNGLLINQFLDEIAKNVSWIRVSVDAAREETFSILRPSHIPNSYERVISNIKKLVQVKQGILGYSFLMVERYSPDGTLITNCHEILDAALLAKKIGCDYFEFKPKVDSHHHLIPLSREVKRSLLQQLPKLDSLNNDHFTVIYPKSIDHLLKGINPDQPKFYTTCPSLELRTVVTPRGIYPCPYKRGYEEAKIGSTNDTVFDKYWRSRKRRTKTQAVNPQRDCSFYCIRHDLNILLLTLADTYDKGINLLPYIIPTETNDIFI